jgi:uncharacterized protein YndB with AHSA1/START domain
MSEDNIEPGTIRRVEGGFEGRLERVYEHDPAALWRMLTDPQALAQWLAPGTIELRAGGAVRIDFADSGTIIDSAVLALEPLRLLAYSWSSGEEPERPLRWELHPVEKGTRLILTVRTPAGEDASKACAGFDAHLDMLAAALEGVPVKFPFERYLEARRHYQQMLAQ